MNLLSTYDVVAAVTEDLVTIIVDKVIPITPTDDFIDQNCNEWKIKNCLIDIKDGHWAESVKVIEEDSSEDSQSDNDSLELPEIANERQQSKRWLDHHTSAVKNLIKANLGKPLIKRF